MGTFTGRGVLSRVFGLAGIRNYFGHWNVQDAYDSVTDTYNHEMTLDNVVLDHYVPEDEIHKRLESNLKPRNFCWVTVPAGILWGATAGPAGAALGGLLGAGVGYAANLFNRAGYSLQEMTSGNEVSYTIESPTISGLIKCVAAQEKEIFLAIGRYLKSEVELGYDPDFTQNRWSWHNAREVLKMLFCGGDTARGTGIMLKELVEEQTGTVPELPELYQRVVSVKQDTKNPLTYKLEYVAKAPKSLIVRDTNRIISTFTGAQFWPKMKERLGIGWDKLSNRVSYYLS